MANVYFFIKIPTCKYWLPWLLCTKLQCACARAWVTCRPTVVTQESDACVSFYRFDLNIMTYSFPSILLTEIESQDISKVMYGLLRLLKRDSLFFLKRNQRCWVWVVSDGTGKIGISDSTWSVCVPLGAMALPCHVIVCRYCEELCLAHSSKNWWLV